MRIAGTEQTRAELGTVRPDLIGAYDGALPRARAEILARLLGALDREPLPGAARVRYPAAAAVPFAQVRAGLSASVDGEQVSDPVVLVERLGWADGFRAEIGNSVANLALAYAHPPVPSPGAFVSPGFSAGGSVDSPGGSVESPGVFVAAGGRPGAAPGAGLAFGGRLADFEQLVVDGHPLHPGCRTRAGLDVAGVLAYAPEHRPVLRLVRIAVPPQRWHGDGPPVLLAHPWQAQRILAEHPWLRAAGHTGPVRPLMSLRTVDTGAGHVKTAVDVQMTSAVRTVSPAALHNGPVLSALLARLTADLPVTVLAEHGAGAVLIGGRPDRRLAHLHRAAPRLAPGEVVLPLAALAAADPGDGRALLHHAAADPYAWWEQLTAVLVPPMLRLLERGVALEAHGQNTLVVLRGGRPVRIVYRDFGGVRVSAARLRAAGIDAPPLAGDLPSDDPDVLRTKLAAALFGTVCGQLTAVLQRGGADPAKLWAVTARAVAATGTADARALLTAPLPVKATTAMRLATDPLDDLWASLDNPMDA